MSSLFQTSTHPQLSYNGMCSNAEACQGWFTFQKNHPQPFPHMINFCNNSFNGYNPQNIMDTYGITSMSLKKDFTEDPFGWTS